MPIPLTSMLGFFISTRYSPFSGASLVVGFLSCALIFPISCSYSCPRVAKLPDFNCDGAAQIVVLGDSLVSGFGDVVNNNQGGYVLRTQKRFPQAKILNFGVQGLKTLDLILDIERAFDGRGDSELADALAKADLVVVDLGRNDRWNFGEPSGTLRNLKRISSLIRTNAAKISDTSPLVVLAVMMFPNRGSQGPWMKDLNSLILKSSTTAAPADLRFDLVSKRLLSSDQIHPTPKGYAALASVFQKYLTSTYPKHVAKLRPDLDKDGLYDIFESSRFGTDPSLADSDSDGVLDGDEVFVR